MIRGKNIVITGIQAWDIEIGSNCKNLALEFSKDNRVLYVNSPLDRMTAVRQRQNMGVIKRKKMISGEISPFEQVNPNLTVFYPRKIIESISQLKPDFVFDWLNKLNNNRFASEIRYAMEELGIIDFYLFNDSDMFRSFHLKELLRPRVYIYYTRDNLVAVEFW